MVQCKLEVYSHYFKIYKVEPRMQQAIMQFARGLIQHKLEKVNGRFVKKGDRVFATKSFDFYEFRFNRNQLEEFLAVCESNGVRKEQMDITYMPLYAPEKAAVRLSESWVPRDNQVPIIDYIVSDGHIKVVTLQTGQGKAHPNNTPIKVPGGWKPIGDLKVGDLVTAPDGTSTEVTGVFPQGVKDIYRVAFWDGRYVDACAEHLWKVFYVNTSPAKRWKIVNTLEMLRLISMPNPRVYVQLIESEQTPDVILPIKPYTLGAILGDGCLTGDSITVTKGDVSLFRNIQAELPDSLHLVKADDLSYRISKVDRTDRNEYVAALTELGLMGKSSWEKSIPEIYLNASTQQREDLLRGLMDTDGTIGAKNAGCSISFSSSSLALAEGVVTLVRSLGGIASLSQRPAFYTYKGVKLEGRTHYRVNIRVKDACKLFSLDSKLERAKLGNQYSADLKLRVAMIADCGVSEATCISVAHPEHLYVAKDYIVTHNTSCGLKAAEIISNRLGIVVLGRYFDKWVTDVSAQYRLPKNRLLAIRGYKQLQQVLYSMAIEPLDADVIIITSTTMQDYITHYEGSRFKDQEPWLVPPDRLWQHLGVGFRIIDEAHQHFHLNFTMDLYTHIPKALYLSATLEPDDPFIDRMYKIAYPMATRVNGGEYIKYCHVTAIGYRLAFKDKVRYKGFGGAYSHTTYEEWLMKKAKPLQNYLDLIYSVVENEYLNKREPGQKMLIFAGTVELCKLIRDDLKFRPRMKGVSIEKYTSEDPYEVIQSTDVVTTTLGSAGTAIDVPGLLCCLMTTSISGTQANLQAMGRLRELRAYPNSLPHFLYLYCLDIGKQVEYHDKKKRIFNGKVLSHREIEAAKII